MGAIDQERSTQDEFPVIREATQVKAHTAAQARKDSMSGSNITKTPLFSVLTIVARMAWLLRAGRALLTGPGIASKRF